MFLRGVHGETDVVHPANYSTHSGVRLTVAPTTGITTVGAAYSTTAVVTPYRVGGLPAAGRTTGRATATGRITGRTAATGRATATGWATATGRATASGHAAAGRATATTTATTTTTAATDPLQKTGKEFCKKLADPAQIA